MIREDYVSFEVAQLLKDKGFDELCYACYEYFESGVTLYKGWPFEYKGEPVHNTNERVKCPTLQMVMKWLREVHNLCIEPYYVYDGYLCAISKIPTGVEVYYSNEGGDKDSGRFATFEQACEAAILYCLTKLI